MAAPPTGPSSPWCSTMQGSSPCRRPEEAAPISLDATIGHAAGEEDLAVGEKDQVGSRGWGRKRLDLRSRREPGRRQGMEAHTDVAGTELRVVVERRVVGRDACNRWRLTFFWGIFVLSVFFF